MKSCEECGAMFTPHRSHKAQRWCGGSCAQRARRAREKASRPPRACAGCGTLFQVTTNLRLYCTQECRHAHYRKRAPARWVHIERRYGLTQDDVAAMLAAQGGRCAICAVDLDGESFSATAPNIDHDHETGAVRAILCKPCNLALGLLRDDAETVRSALDYLLRWKAPAARAS